MLWPKCRLALVVLQIISSDVVAVEDPDQGYSYLGDGACTGDGGSLTDTLHVVFEKEVFEDDDDFYSFCNSVCATLSIEEALEYFGIPKSVCIAFTVVYDDFDYVCGFHMPGLVAVAGTVVVDLISTLMELPVADFEYVCGNSEFDDTESRRLTEDGALCITQTDGSDGAECYYMPSDNCALDTAPCPGQFVKLGDGACIGDGGSYTNTVFLFFYDENDDYDSHPFMICEDICSSESECIAYTIGRMDPESDMSAILCALNMPGLTESSASEKFGAEFEYAYECGDALCITEVEEVGDTAECYVYYNATTCGTAAASCPTPAPTPVPTPPPTPAPTPVPCADDDKHIAALAANGHGLTISGCAAVSDFCSHRKYGGVVQATCPATCGLCGPCADDDDHIAALASGHGLTSVAVSTWPRSAHILNTAAQCRRPALQRVAPARSAATPLLPPA
jgi:hypothetical protein